MISFRMSMGRSKISGRIAVMSPEIFSSKEASGGCAELPMSRGLTLTYEPMSFRRHEYETDVAAG